MKYKINTKNLLILDAILLVTLFLFLSARILGQIGSGESIHGTLSWMTDYIPLLFLGMFILHTTYFVIKDNEVIWVIGLLIRSRVKMENINKISYGVMSSMLPLPAIIIHYTNSLGISRKMRMAIDLYSKESSKSFLKRIIAIRPEISIDKKSLEFASSAGK